MKIQPITNVTDPSNLRITINQVIRQVSDSTGRITLSNGTTTTVNNSKVVPDSVIVLQPRNAAATDAKAFISDISTGVFVVTHIAGTNRVFDYVIIGSI